ncbi:hypothetical protein R3P38DRAFT_3209621 [Favolaschia claudopus]|uniref:Uncharacterized protein n=1 Tax=Favolaschia claudopus TaxID=2862362 RepID=A0AAW0AJ41_9AGAR
MSSASIFAFAFLKNPRVIEETKTVVFDSQIYSIGATIGSLRYFNSDNQDFADVGCYCAVIQPARRLESTPGICSCRDLSRSKSDLGRSHKLYIVSIIPLGSPDTLNNRTHATVHVCGKGKSVSVEGFLTGLELNDDRSVKHFIVDIEKVTFLGNASSTAQKAEESPTTIINTGTPARLTFTGFFGDQAPISTNTSEPNPKKHKLNQHANELQDNGHRSGGGANKHSIIECPVFV